jgi:hypothetical protein
MSTMKLELFRPKKFAIVPFVLLHSDTVQSIKKEIDLQELPLFFGASAHIPRTGKGFAFCRKNSGLQPVLWWRTRKGCERKQYQAAGMAKALDFLCNLEGRELRFPTKKKCLNRLEIDFPLYIMVADGLQHADVCY